MNKSQLYTLSGALLASTALAGVAQAGSVGRVNQDVSAGGSFSTTAAPIANTVFSSTASTANAVSFTGATGGAVNPIAVSFTNNLPFGTRFNVTINISGAQFNNSNATAAILARAPAGTATFVTTVQGACGSITPLVDKILVSNCSISGTSNVTTAFADYTTASTSFAGGLQLSGIVFNNASGLASAGTSIALSGTVNDQANPSTVLENISSSNVVTSRAPISTTVTAGTSAVTNAATTPTAFTNFSSGGGAGLTVTMATVAITSAGALATDLNTVADTNPGSGNSASSSVTITVTSGALTDDALASLTASAPLATTLTPAAFSGSTATISSTADPDGTTTINAIFDGSHAIEAAQAGTVSVAYGAAGESAVQAAAGASGTTAAITSGGFQAEFNTALASGGDFQSFLRIHNSGSTAGTVTITVLNDSTGASMGTYTTGSIAVGQTLQVDMPTIESGAGITDPSGQYTLQVAGPIVGYAQHVLYNPTTGQFSDLSGFRNSGDTNNAP